MCRLTAYIGNEIPLENIILLPKHSLLVQSLGAQESKVAINGDGFGIAWYGHLKEAGLYKDVSPAWSDSNLPDICRLVRSKLFLAHVRASTVGGTSRANCHPFTYKNWSFMHNGGLGDFLLMRRALENLLPDKLYSSKCGNTDSELFFLLLLANGLENDLKLAIENTIAQIMSCALKFDALSIPVRISCVISDGEKLYGFRYASDDKSPSLYLSECLDHGGRALASEPLDGRNSKWQKIDEGVIVELSADGTKILPLRFGLTGADDYAEA